MSHSGIYGGHHPLTFFPFCWVKEANCTWILLRVSISIKERESFCSSSVLSSTCTSQAKRQAYGLRIEDLRGQGPISCASCWAIVGCVVKANMAWIDAESSFKVFSCASILRVVSSPSMEYKVTCLASANMVVLDKS